MILRPGFTGATIDRADLLRLDRDRIAELAASPDARLLSLNGADPALDGESRLTWVRPDGCEELIFLGIEGDTPLFAPLTTIDPTQRAWSVFPILGLMAPEDAALWGMVRSLIAWHGRHGFCANCGAATRTFRAGWGRKCDSCSAEHFPRVDPVVIMLATLGERVLLGRQPRFPPRRYSALAGFVEVGESLEAAVARELFEESGVRVRNVHYVGSQPWPFPSSLMIACTAEAEDEAITIDTTELEDARWFGRDEVAAAMAGEPDAAFIAPPPYAIAHSLLAHWLAA